MLLLLPAFVLMRGRLALLPGTTVQPFAKGLTCGLVHPLAPPPRVPVRAALPAVLVPTCAGTAIRVPQAVGLF